MPLTPEFFPDTLVEPFIVAPELKVLAESVISGCDEFRPIADAMREQGLSIAYVFETKPFDPTKDDFKPHIIAKVTKASPLWRLLAGYELAIQFRSYFWDVFDANQRTAVVHHELTHVEVDEPGEDGKLKLKLREHDVEDFTATMRRFGPIIPGRAAFVKAFLDWQHAQERPEPTKLRRVPAPVDVEAAPAIAADIAKGALGRAEADNEDLRPTGEVNADELRGAAERDATAAERSTDGAEPDDLTDLPF